MTIAQVTGGIAALRAAGLRITPQRLAVLECLSGNQTHPTAQELHERLRRRFPTMSVATVYNTLNALHGIGYCRKLDLGGPSRFDPNVTAHDHALCDGCGAMRDVVRTRQVRPTALESLPDFKVERVEQIYRGLCASCARAA